MENEKRCPKTDCESRSAYSSLEEAEKAATHIRNHFGWDPVSYRCPKCNKYHHSPVSNHTPSKPCPDCVDGKGEPKQLYETLEAARRRADIIYNKRGTKLYIYHCYYQPGYHLTKNKGVRHGMY